MSRYVFLYKENTEDRDCCAYIEKKAMRWECGHCFGGVNLHGACYCGGTFASYEDIKTVLTKEEYLQLIEFSKELSELGYGIEPGSERYNRGVKLCEAIQPIYDKLLSEENESFFEEIQAEEAEYLMDEYSLDEWDVQEIFNEYRGDYRDRGIVSCVFDDTYSLGYEEALKFWSIDKSMEKYFDFEKFGEDLLEDERYMELISGRIVVLSY